MKITGDKSYYLLQKSLKLLFLDYPQSKIICCRYKISKLINFLFLKLTTIVKIIKCLVNVNDAKTRAYTVNIKRRMV